jgi:hypothetical protein
MSETTATPQEQSKTEVAAGLDRLSQDPNFIFDTDNATEKPVEETTTATEETAKLEGEKPETEIVEEKKTEEESFKDDTKAEEKTETATEEDGFKDDDTNTIASEQGTWKAYLEANEIPIPEDFSEDKGFEVVLNAEKEKIKAEYEQLAAINKENVFEILPEETRSEAKLIFDLMAQGQTLEQINAPINSINELRALAPEQLIRKNLEGLAIYTPEQIDYQIEKMVADGKVELEHGILMNSLKLMEDNINTQRKEQINQYNARQEQVKEQKRLQELNSFKTALDKKTTFMDKKLTDDNKRTLLNEFSNGATEQLLKNPDDIAEFMLWKKYGKQGLSYLKAKAQEEATLAKMKAQHNIPQDATNKGMANTTTTETKNNYASGIDRVANDPAFK